MVNPNLSRRVARVIGIMVTLGLTIDLRFAFAKRVDLAQDFSDLSESDKRAILAAEKIARSGLSFSEILDLKDQTD